MNWHARYAQQARWTRDLRAYIFHRIQPKAGDRILEAGCGTGAVLSDLPPNLTVHGLDIDPVALEQCRIHASATALTLGDALSLPYADKSFDIAYCHFLLLWVRDPLRALLEMKRVTRPGGNVVAFAEPDYTQRVDEPVELARLGQWQMEALKKQGADPGFGSELAEFLFQAGIKIVETGTIQGIGMESSAEDWEMEWSVIESDLAGIVPESEIRNIKNLDTSARAEGRRALHVPTYFAWGRVSDS